MLAACSTVTTDDRYFSNDVIILARLLRTIQWTRMIRPMIAGTWLEISLNTNIIINHLCNNRKNRKIADRIRHNSTNFIT